MDFEKLEKALFEDDDFLRFLPILMEKNWKKATASQRLRIFDEIQKVVHQMDEKYPSLVGTEDFDGYEEYFGGQSIVFSDEFTLFEKDLFLKSNNPYDIIANYFFELSLCDLYENLDDEEFLNTELGKRIKVNCTRSPLGSWDNYCLRANKKFETQPIVYESDKRAKKIILHLLKHMNKEFGMDRFIGYKASQIMLASFQDKVNLKAVEEHYKEMLQNVDRYKQEEEDLNKFNEYVNQINFDDISDEEFYSFFNVKIMNILDWDQILFLLRKFVERELKGCANLEEIVESCSLEINEEEELISLIVNGQKYECDSYVTVFHYLIIFVANTKLREGLETGIDDEELLRDAKECYEYMFALRDETGHITCDYLPTGYSYEEYKNKFLYLMYNKIDKAIKNSKIFSDGEPALYCQDFVKYEAYLNFAFDMSFEEVKKKQFDTLKSNYNKKMGGSR